MEYGEARLISAIADALKWGDLAEASPWTTARRIDDAISGAPTRVNTTAPSPGLPTGWGALRRAPAPTQTVGPWPRWSMQSGRGRMRLGPFPPTPHC